jgi:hypothetical protein
VAALLGRASTADAPAPEAPLFSFAWVSDIHLNPERIDLAKAAFRHIDEKLRPDFVLFTGDDDAIAAPPRDPARPEPADLRRQRHLKEFLAGNLRAPAVVVPGDNWPGGFDRVFGPAQRSFDVGGLHFLLLAPDRTCHAGGAEGLSVFDEVTWAWIRKDLEASREKPIVVAIHEPVYPPTFLDAMPLRRLLAEHPQAIAALQGHLHADLDLRADGKAYLTAPALGPVESHAFKHVRIYRDRIVFRTVSRDPATGEFKTNRGEQVVEIPPDLRANLRRPEGAFAPASPDAVPPHPHVDDPGLGARRPELLKNIRGFLIGDVRPGRKEG